MPSHVAFLRAVNVGGRFVRMAELRAALKAAGFTDVQLHGLAEPMYFGRDVDDACDFVTEQHAGLLTELPADERDRAVAELRADLAEHQTADGVFYDSAAWLVEARR